MGKNLIQIVIKADGSSAVAGIGDVTKSLGSIGGKAAAGAVAGLGAASVAVAGLGAAGLSAFTGLEQGMNEVFTLMPGITDEAMGKMTGQVNDFAKEFGTLPNEVVPALYQSISAGVPSDNVFSFLETAQKAATGGVTELETAVDGISSVVNAYGSDVISATQASDLMFTAVKLGKTDFTQLSRSLFNVIPTTSALGVGFEDVTAGLAALTAQGTPTTVATTQMRQLFVELSKSTGKASTAFKEAAGVSFKEFIAAGNNTQDALILMEGAAGDLGIGINDLFGSVEAGNAALGLTGKGADRFTSNLEEMAGAAGATDTAFARMDTGLGRTFDKIKARGAVFLSTVGSKLGPAFARLGDGIIYLFEPITNTVLKMFDIIGPFIDQIVNKVFDLVDAFTQVGAGGLLEELGLGPGAAELVSKIMADFQSLADTISTNVAPAFSTLSDNIMPALGAGIAFVNEHWEAFRNGLIAVIAVLAGATVFATVAGLIAAIANPITLVVAAVGLLAAAWTENWFGIQDTLMAFWASAQPVLQTLWEWLGTNIPIAIQALSDFWTSVLLPALQAVWDFYTNMLLPAYAEMFTWLATNIPAAIQTVSDFWTSVLLPAIEVIWDFISGSLIPLFVEVAGLLTDMVALAIRTVAAVWQNVFYPAIEKVASFIGGTLSPIFQTLGDLLGGPVSSAIDTAKSAVDALKGAFDAIKSAIASVISKIQEFRDKLANLSIPAWLTPGSPTPFEIGLVGIGKAMSGPLLTGLNVFTSTAIPKIAAVTGEINEMIKAAGLAGAIGVTGGGALSADNMLGAGAGNTRNSTVVNNFNMNVATQATTSTVTQDFQTMRSFV